MAFDPKRLVLISGPPPEVDESQLTSSEQQEWINAEMRYAGLKALGVEPDDPTWAERRQQSHLHTLEALASLVTGPGFGDDDVAMVLGTLGPEALQETVWEIQGEVPPTATAEVPLQRAIRRALWERIRSWRQTARFTRDRDEFRRLQKLLRTAGKAFTLDRRGWSANATDPHIITQEYYTYEFRLRRALDMLPTWEGARTNEERVEQVAEASAVPAAVLHDLVPWRDTEGVARRPSVSRVSEAARICTAKRFGVTQEHVANVLSKRRPRRPRK